MKNKTGVAGALFCIATTLFAQEPATSAPAQLVVPQEAIRETPPSLRGTTFAVRPYVLPPLAPKERLAIAEQPDDPRKGPRAGVNRAVPASFVGLGSWDRTPASEPFWRHSFQAPEAAGIRVHFRNFDAGKGKVWVHTGDRKGQVLGPYTGKGIHGDGEFWTEILFGDTVSIEFASGGGQSTTPPFEVDQIFHLSKEFANRAAFNSSCFLDAQCFLGDERVAQIASGDALIVLPGGTCSGSLVNDRNSTGTPYFLTAGHCIESASDARDSVFVFSFRTAACNGSIALNYRDYTQVSGSQLLARSNDESFDTMDYAFVRLSGAPQIAHMRLGWTTATPSNSDALLAVTHPHGLPQRFARLNLNRLINDAVMELTPTEGTLDRGSSGGSITNTSGQVLAVNAYGPKTPEDNTICDIPDFRRFSGVTRFSAIYPLIREWLDGDGGNANAPAVLTAPGPGSTLSGESVTFQWTRVAATEYFLYVGDQGVASDNLLRRNVGNVQSATVSGLPTDGRRLYVRLWSHLADGWYSNDYAFTAASGAAGGNTPAVMTSPAPGSALAGSSVTFQWTRVGASEYFLYVGDQGVESKNLLALNVGNVQSHTASGLPTDGRKLYVRLWSHLADGWFSQDYVYTAAAGGGVRTISPGENINGVLSASSPARSLGCGGCFADIYQFTISTPQILVITLNSTSELDPFLRVLDANGNEVATDDDGGGGFNSRISRFFPAGTYRIEATSFGEGETGSYVLSLIRL